MKKFLTLFTALFLMGSMMVVQAVTYTVAGSSSVFGTNWDPEDASNDMTLQDGLYKLVKTDVILQYDVELKVVQDHSWDNNWPASNYILNIPELAVYTVTVTFNAASGTVTATAEKTGEAGPVVSTYTVAGDNTDVFGTGWDPANTNNDMTLEDGLYKWEKQIVMPATTIEFKVCNEHGWGNAWPSSNYQVTFPKWGEYILTITFDPGTQDVNAFYVEKYYTLVGGSAALFGTAWGQDNEDNDMTLQSDGITYKKSYYNVELTAGEIEYKVAADHKWDQTGQYPMSGNQALSILDDGKYNVTFTYVPSDPSLVAEATLIPEQDVYTVVGGSAALFGTEWDTKNSANDMMLQGDGITYVKSYSNVSLTAGDIQYKVAADHDWSQPGEYPTGGLNQTLEISQAGTYDVTFTYVPSAPSLDAVATLIEPSEDPEPADVYTVAGSAEAFGSNWDLSDEENNMILSGENYKLVKHNVILTEDVEFKVCKNHGWNPSWPADNYVLAIPEKGVYTVIVYFNESTEQVTAEAIKHTFTVAGSAAAFGSSWNEGETNNDMTFDAVNKVFIWQKEDLTLEDNVELKVVQDHSWDNNWPADNYILVISETAKYTVTVTFDPSTPEVTALAEKTGEAGPVAPPTYTVAGTTNAFGSYWDASDESNNMTLVGESYTLVKENLTLEGNVEFKVCKNHDWNPSWPADNYVLAIPEPAIYTITITFDESTHEVTALAEKTGEVGPVYETVRENLAANRYYTLCFNRTMEAVQGATFWTFASKDANMAYLVQEDAPYAAGKPYIIYAEAAGDLTAVLSGDVETNPGVNGALHGTFSLMEQTHLNAAGENIYLLMNNQLRRVDGQSGNSLPAYRAYIALDEIANTGAPANVPAHRVRAIPMHKDVVTGFENLNATDKPVKMLIDGNIYILRGEKMYDATGRLVK